MVGGGWQCLQHHPHADIRLAGPGGKEPVVPRKRGGGKIEIATVVRSGDPFIVRAYRDDPVFVGRPFAAQRARYHRAAPVRAD
jgi:hypothetical protein